jgi:hypothetical protein
MEENGGENRGEKREESLKQALFLDYQYMEENIRKK